MAGRNGNDQLNMFLLAADLVLLILGGIFARGVGRVLSPLALVLLVLLQLTMVLSKSMAAKLMSVRSSSKSRPQYPKTR